MFGRVLSGQDIVRDIENQKVNDNHKPYAEIRVIHCGELVKKSKQSNQDQETTSKKKCKFSRAKVIYELE